MMDKVLAVCVWWRSDFVLLKWIRENVPMSHGGMAMSQVELQRFHVLRSVWAGHS
jgi:hypothetical protein